MWAGVVNAFLAVNVKTHHLQELRNSSPQGSSSPQWRARTTMPATTRLRFTAVRMTYVTVLTRNRSTVSSTALMRTLAEPDTCLASGGRLPAVVTSSGLRGTSTPAPTPLPKGAAPSSIWFMVCLRRRRGRRTTGGRGWMHPDTNLLRVRVRGVSVWLESEAEPGVHCSRLFLLCSRRYVGCRLQIPRQNTTCGGKHHAPPSLGFTSSSDLAPIYVAHHTNLVSGVNCGVGLGLK